MAKFAGLIIKDKKMLLFLNVAKKRLSAASRASAATKKLGNGLGVIVFRDVQQHFLDEKGPDESGRIQDWKRWAPSTLQRYKKIGKDGNQILRDKGRLRQGFTPSKWRDEKKGFLFFNNQQTKKGFPYAYAHDNNEEPRTRLPRRSFMWLSNKALSDMGEITLAWVISGSIIKK